MGQNAQMEAGLAVQTRKRLRAAMEAHDHAAVVELLAPDAILRSPILNIPFEGRGAVADVMGAVLETFESTEYVAELEGDGEQALLAKARVRGRDIEVVSFLKLDDEGLITEIKIVIRPMAGLAAVLTALGPPLARRRGRLQVLAMRLAGPALEAVVSASLALAPRFITLRRR